MGTYSSIILDVVKAILDATEAFTDVEAFRDSVVVVGTVAAHHPRRTLCDQTPSARAGIPQEPPPVAYCPGARLTAGCPPLAISVVIVLPATRAFRTTSSCCPLLSVARRLPPTLATTTTTHTRRPSIFPCCPLHALLCQFPAGRLIPRTRSPRYSLPAIRRYALLVFPRTSSGRFARCTPPAEYRRLPPAARSIPALDLPLQDLHIHGKQQPPAAQAPSARCPPLTSLAPAAGRRSPLPVAASCRRSPPIVSRFPSPPAPATNDGRPLALHAVRQKTTYAPHAARARIGSPQTVKHGPGFYARPPHADYLPPIATRRPPPLAAAVSRLPLHPRRLVFAASLVLSTFRALISSLFAIHPPPTSDPPHLTIYTSNPLDIAFMPPRRRSRLKRNSRSRHARHDVWRPGRDAKAPRHARRSY
ncbi:hypothetical protein GGX14DRAFT_581065 [Mycena pura]|uniref:Uncharacterized protein n=1 Tax=Mycena pura TaxID=153505 RepID=A0AAD6XYS0_9AGAR|nr:hypothetical protein GGX14DRAFT_581065 [Mycena pura]